MYKWGREKQNYFPSEEKRNKNTPLIVAISFSDGLKKKKSLEQVWLKAFWQMHSLFNSKKKKKKSSSSYETKLKM